MKLSRTSVAVAALVSVTIGWVGGLPHAAAQQRPVNIGPNSGQQGPGTSAPVPAGEAPAPIAVEPAASPKKNLYLDLAAERRKDDEEIIDFKLPSGIDAGAVVCVAGCGSEKNKIVYRPRAISPALANRIGNGGPQALAPGFVNASLTVEVKPDVGGGVTCIAGCYQHYTRTIQTAQLVEGANTNAEARPRTTAAVADFVSAPRSKKKKSARTDKPSKSAKPGLAKKPATVPRNSTAKAVPAKATTAKTVFRKSQQRSRQS